MVSRAKLGVLVAFASFVACSRSPKPSQPDADDSGASTAANPSASNGAPGTSSDPAAGAIFSNPIAATHVGDGRGERSSVVVVGLVVPTKTITALRIESDGRIAWKREVLSGVTWSADAELKAYPIANGTVIVWRGQRDGKNAKVLVPLDLDGHLLADPTAIGTLACTTDDGAAWSEPAPGAKARVRLRAWSASNGSITAHDEIGPPVDDDFTLVCGAHRAYALSEGGDESPARVYAVPVAPSFPMTLGAEVFGHDEERDLLPYADGDDFGVVRVSALGGIQIADAPSGAGGGSKPLAARRNKTKIPSDDDIVAVDADAHAAYVVFTHDESDRCKDNRGGESVHALRVARQGDGDSAFLVAPAECGKDSGPFWTGFAGGTFVIAWAERAPRTEKTSAPIASLAFRMMDGKSPVQRIAQPADSLVDAGCVGAHCYAVALVRAPGSDGMRAEAARVIAYP